MEKKVEEEKLKLQNKINKLETQLSATREKIHQLDTHDTKVENYRRFKNRPIDCIIGKAHAHIESLESYTLDCCIRVSGNGGHSYIPNVPVTPSTKIYLHNVFTEQQRGSIQDRINEAAISAIYEVIVQPDVVIKLLGLAMPIDLEEFPQDKIAEVEKDVWDETCHILDRFSDEKLKSVLKMHPSHGSGILHKYLSERRPHLLGK